MKPLLFILLLTVASFGQLNNDIAAKIKTFPKPKQYIYTFDKFTNTSRISYFNRVKASNILDIYVTYAIKTNDGKTSEAYWLRFNTAGREWQFLHNDSFSWLIDGKTGTLEKGERSSEISKYALLYESLIWDVSPDLLESLSKGNEVEIRVSRTEAKLDAGFKEGIGNVLLIAKAMRGE